MGSQSQPKKCPKVPPSPSEGTSLWRGHWEHTVPGYGLWSGGWRVPPPLGRIEQCGGVPGALAHMRWSSETCESVVQTAAPRFRPVQQGLRASGLPLRLLQKPPGPGAVPHTEWVCSTSPGCSFSFCRRGKRGPGPPVSMSSMRGPPWGPSPGPA